MKKKAKEFGKAIMSTWINLLEDEQARAFAVALSKKALAGLGGASEQTADAAIRSAVGYGGTITIGRVADSDYRVSSQCGIERITTSPATAIVEIASALEAAAQEREA